MTDSPPLLPPADWYADPQDQQRQRWWTGAAWSEQIRPSLMPTPPQVAPEWQRTTPHDVTQLQANFQSFDENVAKVPRRGFFDSPFEPRGTPRNRPGTLSLIFALIPFVVAWMFAPFGAIVALVLWTTAIILGIVGIVRAGRIGGRRATAITGLIIGTLALLGSLIPAILAVNLALAGPSASTSLESSLAESIHDNLGVTMQVECPRNVPTSKGSHIICVGTDSMGKPIDIDVSVTDNRGTFEWEFSQSGD